MATPSARWVRSSAMIPLLFGVMVAPLRAQGASLRDGIDQLAAELLRNTVTPRILRVAVADFPDLRGATSDFGRYVAERLTTRLSAATNRFAMTERRRLQQVVGELSLNQSDLVDPRTARRVGEMLGVDALLVGTVSALGDRVDLDARVVEIETNNVVTQGSASIIRDQVVEGLLAAGQDVGPRPAGRRDTSAVARQAVNPATTTPSVLPEFTSRDLFGRITTVSRTGAELRIEMLLTNRGTQEFRVYPCNYTDQAYVVDDTGQHANCSATSTRDPSLVPGVPLRIALTFSGLAASARTATLIWNWGPAQVVVRDIPLQ